MYPNAFIRDENADPNPTHTQPAEEARVKRELGRMVQKIPPELVLKYPPPEQVGKLIIYKECFG